LDISLRFPVTKNAAHQAGFGFAGGHFRGYATSFGRLVHIEDQAVLLDNSGFGGMFVPESTDIEILNLEICDQVELRLLF
jgi:hypothetical protein